MVKLIESCVIKPAKHTPNGLMSLSEFDQVSAITHASIVYFYQSPVDFDSAIVTLKDSLSKVLVTFYPLTGRLQDIGEGRFEVDCNPIGAQFLVAESESRIEDFGDFHPTQQLRTLVPQVDTKAPVHEQPLLLVQVTKLSCGGMCLGFSISQIMVDGSSGFHFTNEWARLARGEQLKNPPFLDRKVLQAREPVLLEPRFNHSEYGPPPVLIGRSDALEEIKKETATVMLKLDKNDIEKLKNKANNGENNYPPRYSRYEVVAGHMWRCACKARRHASQQLTRLYFPMDIRNRMERPLPQFYFGNAVYRAAAATSISGELISKPLSYASSKIREAKAKVTGEYLRSSLMFLKNLPDVSQCRNFHSPIPGAFHGNPNIDINNSWGRQPSDGLDFGWGEEIYGGTAALGSEGKSIIMHSSHKDGSFLIMLHLQVAHIEDFKKFFYGDI